MKDAAYKYAEEVLGGTEPAGPKVFGACEIFMRRLELQKQEKFPYYYDPSIGEDFCLLAKEEFRHHQIISGPLIYEPFQEFWWYNILGWLSLDEDGNETSIRMIHEAWLQVGKGNGKSTSSASLPWWFGLFDGVVNQPIYYTATSLEQSKAVGKSIEAFRNASDYLKRGTVQLPLAGGASVRPFQCIETGCEVRSASRNAIAQDGKRPILVIADEAAEQDGGTYNAFQTGGVTNNPNLLCVCITTAGRKPDKGHWGYAMYLKMSETCEIGSNLWLDRPDLFAYIAEPSVDDTKILMDSISNGEMPDESVVDRALDHANPGIKKKMPDGSTRGYVMREGLKRQIRDCLLDPSKISEVFRAHWDIWYLGNTSWININEWDKNERDEVVPARHCGCYVGIFGARKEDMVSISIFFPSHKYFGVYTWCSEAYAEWVMKRDAKRFKKWFKSRDRSLIISGEKIVDTSQAEEFLLRVDKEYRIESIYSRRGSCSDMVSRFMNEIGNPKDLVTRAIPSSPASFDEGVSLLTAMIKSEEAKHTGSKFLRECAKYASLKGQVVGTVEYGMPVPIVSSTSRPDRPVDPLSAMCLSVLAWIPHASHDRIESLGHMNSGGRVVKKPEPMPEIPDSPRTIEEAFDGKHKAGQPKLQVPT